MRATSSAFGAKRGFDGLPFIGGQLVPYAEERNGNRIFQSDDLIAPCGVEAFFKRKRLIRRDMREGQFAHGLVIRVEGVIDKLGKNRFRGIERIRGPNVKGDKLTAREVVIDFGSYGLENLEGRVRTGTKRKRVRIGRKFVEPRLVILYVAHERLGQFERGALLASGVGCSARRCDDVFDEAVHIGIEGRVRRHHAVAVEGGLCSRANGFRYILLRESPLFSTLREDTACCGIKQAAFIRILSDFLKGQLRTAFGQQRRIAEAVHSPANGVENLLNADAPILVGVKQFQRPCVELELVDRATERDPEFGVKLVEVQQFFRRPQGHLIQTADPVKLPIEGRMIGHGVLL